MLRLARPDLHGQAAHLVRALVEMIRSESETGKDSLQRRLRAVHRRNWAAFLGIETIERERVDRRRELVHDALIRIKSNRDEMSDGSFSPKTSLSPVSPNQRSQTMRSKSVIRGFFSTDQTDDSVYAPIWHNPDESNIEPTSGAARPQGSISFIEQDLDHSDLKETTEANYKLDTDILYIPGYRHNRRAVSSQGFQGQCPICWEPDTLLAMLLKKPPAALKTPNFALPNSRQRNHFPLAYGTFPETDILSSFVRCDSCAYFLVKDAFSPYDEEIIAAIPLIPEAISGKFEEKTFDLVDDALCKRFERPAVKQIFLAILYCTLDNIPEGENEELEKEALRWTCPMLSLCLSLPCRLSTSFDSGNISPRGYLPLPLTLSQNMNNLPDQDCALLQYPIGGFVVMILAMIDLNLEPRPGARSDAVSQRYLFHLTEKHCEALMADHDAAVSELEALIFKHKSIDSSECSKTSATTSGASASLTDRVVLYTSAESLRDTHLLSSEEFQTLERLGLLFDFVKESCSSATAVFLFSLNREATVAGKIVLSPIDCYNRIRAREALGQIFISPAEIDKDRAGKLIGYVEAEKLDFALQARTEQEIWQSMFTDLAEP